MVACSGGSMERGGRRQSAPVRRHSGGDWAEKPGLGASLEVWEGGGAAGLGNGEAERRRHGELELTGVNGGRWRLCARAGGSTPFIGKG